MDPTLRGEGLEERHPTTVNDNKELLHRADVLSKMAMKCGQAGPATTALAGHREIVIIREERASLPTVDDGDLHIVTSVWEPARNIAHCAGEV